MIDKRTSFFAFMLLVCWGVKAQSPVEQVAALVDSLSLSNIFVDENSGKVVSLFINEENVYVPYDSQYYYFSFLPDDINQSTEGYRVSLDFAPLSLLFSFSYESFLVDGTLLLPLYGTGNGAAIGEGICVLSFDVNSSQVWAIGGESFRFKFGAYLDDSGELTIASAYDSSLSLPDALGVYHLDGSGNLLWAKMIELSSLSDVYYLDVYSVEKQFETGNYYVLGQLCPYPLLDCSDFSNSSFLIVLDESGTFLQGRYYPDVAFSKLELDEQGGAFLLGSSSVFSGISGNDKDCVIVKVGSSLVPVWTKVLALEHFNYRNADLKLVGDRLAILYSTFGAFPTTFISLDTEGGLLWNKGYALYEPFMGVRSDGTFVLASKKHFTCDGELYAKAILANADSVGDIQNCSIYSVCVSLYDVEIVTASLSCENVGAPPPLLPLDVLVEPWSCSYEEFCDIPPPPTPYFTLPDTICAGDCLSPDSIYNRLAHQVEWYISGPGGLDTTIVDTTFNWCFEEAGTYQIEQGVWLLGCSDFYSRELVVLSDDLDLLGTDRTLCEEPPYSLSANAGRPLLSYLWNDGSTAPELEVNSSGTYSLEAFDGYCTLRDTVALTFLQDLLTEGPPLTLPADTVVCEQHLPYVLAPYSPYTEIPPQQLWQAGSYAVEAEVFGCPFLENFELSLSDCRSRIYFPTAFSPNGDGLNDQFLPQGKDYEGIELQVYDRWGGLLYSVREAPFAWDGGNAPAGVYTWLFRYLNTLSGEEEVLSGEVNLVR